MADLFQQTRKQDYTAQDIEVLDGLEPVRKRPGMYIGGVDEKALHHLIVEVLDNAMDEVIARHAHKIEVFLEKGNFITIRDNGRGIPIDPHPKFPHLSALEVILTTLHSGGKFNNNVYHVAGGLHGIGASVVNALSDTLEVEICRNRQCWIQKYSQGKALTPLERKPEVVNKRGTSIRFHPDPEIFGDFSFNPTTIFNLLHSKAYLFKGVEIIWKCDEELLKDCNIIPSSFLLHYPKGLVDYLEDRLPKENWLFEEVFCGEVTSLNSKVEWAIVWSEEKGHLDSFCNTISTPQGGAHETGFRQALIKSLKDFGGRVNYRKINQVTVEDVFDQAIGVLSCFMPQPQFQGQTKEKLVSFEATRLVESVIKDHFDHWLVQHAQSGQRLLEFVVLRAEERLKRKQSKDIARLTATKRLRLPGKLADCVSQNAQETEIFLVEGDSAGGSAKQARDRFTQAVLPLRGKILNVVNASFEKLKANQELANLALALGCSMGKLCDPFKLRYDRVIIMTDADVDGAHIASLLLTFFLQEMRPLVERGHLYLAQPPLYRLTSKEKTIYARDDREKEVLLKTGFKKSDKIEIARFKGLGEMLPVQLRDTTMNKEKRTLLRIMLNNDHLFVDQLMGKNADFRFQFIQENAFRVQNLDV